MTTKDTSGPAFPVSIPAGHYWTGDAPYGLTKREYFAGMAMQAYLTGKDRDEFTAEQWSEAAFVVADAMIAEGNKQ